MSTNIAAYSYLANSPLVSQIFFTNGTALRMTTTKQYDFLNRLTSISSVPSASSAISFDYSYNNANERTRRREADGSLWIYSYDSLGQVKSGKKLWADWTPVAGQQFEYAFDDIGNRISTKAGGNENGSSLRTANYSANNLNQYASRDIPATIDVLGLSYATNAVTVNGQTAYRKGEYFRAEVPLDNSSSALWTNIAVSATGQSSVTGKTFLAKSPESFVYDADGNLVSDGRWTNHWDAENRLISMESLSNAPAGSKLKLDFTYDFQSRRIQKLVSTNNGSSYGPLYTNSFVYDGWNLAAELQPINSQPSALIRSYAWGLDLSGSLRGAGGVGGLLFVNDQSSISNQPSTDFMAYDAYGNAIATVNVTSGSPSARYEYGPFGELLRVTGSMANRSPVRFSTKYQDIETGFTCYGYRFLNTSAGRWLSRDPAVDMPRRWSSDFSNPYHFTLNDPLNFVDTDGRQLFPGGPFPVPFPPIEPGPVDPRPPGWPPNVPYVPKCMRCKCKSVTITGKPVDPPGVGWYAAGSPGNSKGVYGNDMTITWWVSGDPKECTYGQDESGGSLAVPTSGGGGEKQSNYNDHPDVSKLAAITYGQESATYHDQMGIYFSAPRDNGAWEYTLDLMIKFTCTSSDGTKMTGATHHFDDYGTLYFSGHGDE